MRAFRIIALGAIALSLACTEPLLGPPAATDRASLFDDVWRQFDLHYSFFELKHINWDSIGAHYRPLAVAATSDQAFASVLGRMLAELKDVHVTLTPTGTGPTIRYMSARDAAATNFNAEQIFQRYVPTANSHATAHMRCGMVTATVGYIQIASFGGDGWAGEMDDALSYLANATTLVIDVRDNPGGNYVLAADVAGRFADSKRTYAYVRRRNGPAHSDFTDYIAETIEPRGPTQFRGSVYVLTNHHDFSSAEDFVLAMRTLPSVKVVGDTTAGASGGPIVREMANGWRYQLSEWIEYTPERSTFEGVGLAPNSVVKTAASFAAQTGDATMDRAMAMAAGR